MMIRKVHIRFFHFALNFWDIKVHLVPVPRLLCTTWGLEACFRKWKLTFLDDHFFGGAGVLNKTSNKRKSEELSGLSLPAMQFRSAVLKSCHLMVTRRPVTQSSFLRDRCVLGWCNKITTCRKISRAVLQFLILTSPAMRLGDHGNCEILSY